MNLRNTLFAALAVGLLAAGSANAGTATGSFDVNTNVQGSCVVTSADNIAFGTYDPTNTNASAALDAQGKVSVRCTVGSIDVKVALDEGVNKDAASTCAAPARRVKSASGATINYGIYSDSSRAAAWGCDATNVQNIASFASSLTPVDLITYGRVPGGQNAEIGSYADTVGVNVTF